MLTVHMCVSTEKNNFKTVETGVFEKYMFLKNYLRKEFVVTVYLYGSVIVIYGVS